LPGILYAIATPIGNLEDITFRAVRILREEVSIIACEDTRQTRKLLDRYEIRKALISYHEHNEKDRAQQIVVSLERGENVALISDAGTPLVSDPGYRVVKAAIEAGFNVVPVPGPSAILAALIGSGLATDEFRFIGFLPSKTGARRKVLASILNETATVVAYESPHRILETLAEMRELYGERPIVLAREMTKMHEEFLRGSTGEILKQFQSRPSVKGEITLVIGRPEEASAKTNDPATEVLKLQREEGLDRMEAVKAVAKRFGLPKREVYRLAAAPDNSRAGRRHH